MLLQLIRKNNVVTRLYLGLLEKTWVNEKVQRILPFLQKSERILDIGAGNGLLANQLIKQGYQVTPVDVANLAIPESIKVVVYDGKKLPFDHQSHDTGLLLTVLHHTQNPVEVLKEVARVVKKVIIIEDVYRNSVQKYLTFAMDTLVNFGHSQMTYQNRSTEEWKAIFRELGLELKQHREKRVLFFFRQATFVVENP
ncbi:MAG: class I SAM-dependent methyltransferase [Bacteroidota bacterium]